MSKFKNSLEIVVNFLTKGIVIMMPLFFLPWTVEYFEYNKQFLFWIGILILFAIWLIKAIASDRLSYRKTVLDAPILLFLLFGSISAFLSVDKFASWFGYYGNSSDSWLGSICFALFYFILLQILVSRQKIISYIKLLMYSSGLAIFIALLSMLGFLSRWASWSFNTISGSFNNLVLFDSVIAVVILGFLFFGNNFLKKYERNIFRLILLVILIEMCLFPLIKAWSILLIGILVLIILIFFTDKKWFGKRQSWLVCGLILLAGLFISSPNLNLDNLLLGRNLPKEITLSLADSVKISQATFFDNPFFGTGPGSFAHNFSLYRPANFNNYDIWQFRFDKSSSYVLEMIETKGGLTFLSFFSLISIFLFFCITIFWKSRNEETDLFLILFPGFISVLGILVSCPVGTMAQFLFWFFLALIMAYWLNYYSFLLINKEINLTEKNRAGRYIKMFLLLLIVVVTLLIGYVSKFWVADVFYKAGGEKNIEKAVQLNPYRYNYYIGQAEYYLNKIKAKTAQIDGQEFDYVVLQDYLNRAINSALQATAVNPIAVVGWETAGMIYRDTSASTIGGGIWAIEAFSKALELEPTNPVLATELGKAYTSNNQTDQAIKYFIKALELKNDYYEAGFALAKAYIKKGQEVQAEMLLTKLADRMDSAEVYYELGRFYYNQGEIEKAIEQFNRVVELFPNHSNAVFSLGIAYEAISQNEEALLYYKKALELNPGNNMIIDRIQILESGE